MSLKTVLAVAVLLSSLASFRMGRPDNLTVRLPRSQAAVRAVEIGGRVVFDGSELQPPADLSRVIVFTWDAVQEDLWRQIDVGRAPNIFPQAAASTDGTFRLWGLLPGTAYTVEVGRVPRGWWLRSAVIDGRDILDVPLDVGSGTTNHSDLVVTLTDRRASLSGIVRTPAHEPVRCRVVVFPASEALWRAPWRRVRTVPTDIDGAFTVAGLNAGEYFAVAVPDDSADSRSIKNASFLSKVRSQSVALTLREGVKTARDLTLSSVGR